MFTGMHHANIVVSDLEKSKKFYTEVLGLQVALQTEIDDPEFARGVGIPGTKLRAVFFSVPNTPTLIEMFEYVAPHKSKSLPAGGLPSDVGIGHLAFQVQDIDAAYQRLKEMKIPFISSPVTLSKSHKDVGGVRFCYFRDPDGILLELIWFPPSP